MAAHRKGTKTSVIFKGPEWEKIKSRSIIKDAYSNNTGRQRIHVGKSDRIFHRQVNPRPIYVQCRLLNAKLPEGSLRLLYVPRLFCIITDQKVRSKVYPSSASLQYMRRPRELQTGMSRAEVGIGHSNGRAHVAELHSERKYAHHNLQTSTSCFLSYYGHVISYYASTDTEFAAQSKHYRFNDIRDSYRPGLHLIVVTGWSIKVYRVLSHLQ